LTTFEARKGTQLAVLMLAQGARVNELSDAPVVLT
jgi:hypothetical protein